MSENTASTADTTENSEESVKPSLIKRGVSFVKTHKKASIALVVLTGLVVASAFVPIEDEPTDSFEELEERDGNGNPLDTPVI